MEYLGFFIASLLISKMADPLGRRKTMMIGFIFWIISQFLGCLSLNVAMYSIMRCVNSTSFMLVILNVYTLIAETMTFKMRGICNNVLCIFVSAGQTVSILVAFNTFNYFGEDKWRFYMAIMGILVLFTFAVNFAYLDESVRYNIFKGNYEDAFDTIKKISTENLNSDGFLDDDKKQGLIFSASRLQDEFKQKMNSSGYSNEPPSVFKGPYRSITFKLFFVWFAVVSTCFGVEFILPTYLKQIYHRENFSSNDSLKYFMGLNLATIPLLMLMIWAVETSLMGRKKTLHLLFSIVTIGSFFVYFFGSHGFIFWVIFIKFGYQGNFILLFLYTNELYPTSLRITAVGKCSAIGRIGAMIIPWIEIYSMDIDLYFPFIIFFLINALALVNVIMIPYETRNKGIEKIVS